MIGPGAYLDKYVHWLNLKEFILLISLVATLQDYKICVCVCVCVCAVSYTHLDVYKRQV